MILFLFFFPLGFILENTLEHHIHILRKGTVALFGKRLDSFDNIMIKRKTHCLLQRLQPLKSIFQFIQSNILDYIVKSCVKAFIIDVQ